MELGIGTITEGKVTGIMKFGAFVALPSGKSGLVHISEIASTYVNNVSDHLKEGETVKVKIIGIDENGRINLSIKQTVEQPQGGFQQRRPQTARRQNFAQNNQPPATPESMFEDKLKRFMQESDSKIAGVKQYERKTSTRRGKK